MKKKFLFIVLILQLCCVISYAQTVDIFGDDVAAKGSTCDYVARTGIVDPNYLYNWMVDGGDLIGWGPEVSVKWGTGDRGRIRVHCIVQYRGDRTCDKEVYVRLIDGFATLITTSPFGELCMAEPCMLERYLPSYMGQ